MTAIVILLITSSIAESKHHREQKLLACKVDVFVVALYCAAKNITPGMKKSINMTTGSILVIPLNILSNGSLYVLLLAQNVDILG